MTLPAVRPFTDGTVHEQGIALHFGAAAVAESAHLLDRCAVANAPLAVDIETHGLGPKSFRIKAVSLSDGATACVLDPRTPQGRDVLRAALREPVELVMHSSTFDAVSLAVNGLLTTEAMHRITDTLLLSRMATPSEHGGHGLSALATRYLPADHPAVQDAGGDRDMKWLARSRGMTLSAAFDTLDLDSPAYAVAAAGDAVLTALVLPALRAAAVDRQVLDHPFSTMGLVRAEAVTLVEREQTTNRVMLAASARGMRVDLAHLDDYRDRTAARVASLAATLTAAGMRTATHRGDLMAQLQAADALPSTYPRTKGGSLSSTRANLDTLVHPLAAIFREHADTTKVGSYFTAAAALTVTDAQGDERIHPRTHVLAAITGRMSVSDPPLQQFPGDARGILLADRGDSLTSLDWSQVEPVLAANLAGDSGPLATYEQPGGDLYLGVAEAAGVTRKEAKVVLLAQLYGEGIVKLATDLGVSEDDARGLRRSLWRAMPRTARLVTALRDVGERHRLALTLSGRVLPVPMGPGWDGGPPTVQTHKAVNYTVQGGAYDILSDTIARVHAAGLSDAVYLAMHDELVVSTDAAHDIRTIMETPPDRLTWWASRRGRTTIPVLRTDRADLGDRWAAA